MVDTVELFVPGRLCLLGEHTDWASAYRDVNPEVSIGRCLVCTTNEGVFARVAPQHQHAEDIGRAPQLTYLHTDQTSGRVETFTHELHAETLQAVAKQPSSFFAYVAGTAAAMLQYMASSGHKSETAPLSTAINSGIRIDNYKTSLPMKKGLSSSAAVCVLVVHAFASVYKLHLTDEIVMQIACAGEKKTSSQCGMMDFCVTMGAGVGLMTMNKGDFSLRRIHVSQALHIVVGDLRALKDTVAILRDLNSCFPVARSPAEHQLHDYVDRSQLLCLDAVQAIQRGDLVGLASAMKAAQISFDDGAMVICPEQLTSPRLHEVMSSHALQEVALAVKGVGSQGDGTVQVLCESAASQLSACDLLRNDMGCDVFTVTVPISVGASDKLPIVPFPMRIRYAIVMQTPTNFALPVSGQEAKSERESKSESGSGSQGQCKRLCQELFACAVEYVAVIGNGQDECIGGGARTLRHFRQYEEAVRSMKAESLSNVPISGDSVSDMSNREEVFVVVVDPTHASVDDIFRAVVLNMNKCSSDIGSDTGVELCALNRMGA